MQDQEKERWTSKLGIILAVASSAIGLGNFLRFPGQAVQNGGGAFMVPYIISFILLGIPVCLSEWIMGRMGGVHGHSSPNIFRNFLTGVPLRFVSSIGILVPILIYVYYVFVEAWCLAYAIDFLRGAINLHPAGLIKGTPEYTEAVVKNANIHFSTLTGSTGNGDSFSGNILLFTTICFMLNFYLVYRGISKGLEAFAKIAVPVLLVLSLIILGRVLTLDGIEKGLGKMWNPDWSSLLRAEVWIAAAGQIFFSLSVGFGIVLIFSSYLSKKDDVTLSGLSAASLNEFVEIGFGGMITIPIAFIFLGASVASFSTFGMGFVAMPVVFSLMPLGQIFGATWFFVLFIAAVTSSVTMIQPGITFLEEGFGFKRRKSVPVLFFVTFCLTLLIVYFNKDFTALDQTDFWVGTFLIYVLATFQVIIYGWVIGVEKGYESGHEGSLLKLPKIFNFVVKFITPTFLICIFVFFLFQNAPDYIRKMNVSSMVEEAIQTGKSVVDAENKAKVALGVFLSIFGIFIFTYFLVDRSLRNIHRKEEGLDN